MSVRPGSSLANLARCSKGNAVNSSESESRRSGCAPVDLHVAPCPPVERRERACLGSVRREFVPYSDDVLARNLIAIALVARVIHQRFRVGDIHLGSFAAGDGQRGERRRQRLAIKYKSRMTIGGDLDLASGKAGGTVHSGAANDLSCGSRRDLHRRKRVRHEKPRVALRVNSPRYRAAYRDRWLPTRASVLWAAPLPVEGGRIKLFAGRGDVVIVFQTWSLRGEVEADIHLRHPG